jgi:hypothetical protein
LLKTVCLIRLLQEEAEISFLTQKRSVQRANKSRSPRSKTRPPATIPSTHLISRYYLPSSPTIFYCVATCSSYH